MDRATARPWISALAGLALLATALPTFAYPSLGLELGGLRRWHADPSWDLVAENDSVLGPSATLNVAITPRLALTLGYDYGRADGAALGQTVDTRLRLHEATLAVRYTYELLDWLQVFARMGGGAQLSLLDLSLGSAEDRSDRALAGFFAMGGGLIFLPGPLRNMPLRQQGLFSETTVGFVIDGGYQVSQDLVFDGVAESDSYSVESAAIRRPDLDLGPMNLGGWDLRLAAVLLF